MINGKIETAIQGFQTASYTQSQMKVIATVDTTLLCGVLDFGGKKYYLDLTDFNKFVLQGKKFNFINETDIYPSHLHNYKCFSLLENIFIYNSNNINYVFKNDNPCDLRRTNVEIYHKFHDEVKAKYKVIEYIQGHYISNGNDAFVLKNPMWRVLNDLNQEELLMYCEKDILLKICDESHSRIVEFEKNYNDNKKITFYKQQNGYICCTLNLYIHQIITGCHGNGKGTKNVSVDHIDQDPLNNSFQNLRIATREEQEQNCKGTKDDGSKRERKHNARELPDGITHDMLSKYVVYYHEWLDKEKTKGREFFKVEKHPKLDKPWMTSKSNKISIQDKLKSANKIVEDLKNNIHPTNKDDAELPTYVTLKVERKKPHLVFDRKTDDGKRLNLRMVLPDEYNLQEQLHIFKGKIKAKYDISI